MKTITECKEGAEIRISRITGELRFVNRAVSIGLTPGSRAEIIKNRKNRPLLVYSRDTMIALNHRECENIYVEEV